MKSVILALALVLALPAFANQPVPSKNEATLAKKKKHKKKKKPMASATAAGQTTTPASK